MSIVKVKRRDNPFVQIDKSVFEDDSISWKAKGVLGYLLSKPDDWKIHVSDIAKHAPKNEKGQSKNGNGEAAIYEALRELRAAGYATLKQKRENGVITGSEWQVSEIKGYSPYPDNQDVANQDAENRDHSNNKYRDNKSTVVLQTTDSVFTFDEFWNEYGYKKGSKANAEKKYKSLPEKTRQQIKDTLPLYVAETVTDDRGRAAGAPFRPMRKHPEFYLSGRIWENYIELAAEKKIENETLYPEWTDEYNQYLQWAETHFPGILKAVKQMSKAQFVRYRTEYYVPGKSFVGGKTERRIMTQVHRDMNNDPNLMNKYPDVFAYHCQLIEKEVKASQI